MMKFWFKMTMKLCFIALILLTKKSFCSELPHSETVAVSTEVSSKVTIWSPEFVKDLLPSAERTALLYRLSYLSLGKFPKLERLIRERAIETQMLFGYSEAVLMKCVYTSNNLVETLFPILRMAAEVNRPALAVRSLDKAKEWITDMIKQVEELVKRYDQHNQNLATSASDVYQEKEETQRRITQKTEAMISLSNTLNKLSEELQKNTESREKLESQIREKSTELQNLVESSSRRNTGLTIFAALVPFIGAIVKSIVDAVNLPGEAAKIQGLKTELNRLSGERIGLQNRAWAIQIEQMEHHLQMSKYSTELGLIPDPIPLTIVQQSLTRIQSILLQLLRFWQEVNALLENLKKETFVGQDLIDYLYSMKDEFLETVDTAETYWKNFGQSCQNVQDVFRVQSKDAYHFLETNPSSLLMDAWESEYNSAVRRLNKISPAEPTMAAVTERPMLQ